MLLLSNFNIEFKPSRDFLRTLTLIHIAAGFVLTQSALHSILIAAGLVYLYLSNRKTSNTPLYQRLSYHQAHWLLQDAEGQEQQYDTLHVRFDSGFCLLIQLKNQDKKQNIVIWRDQIPSEAYRRLIILTRIAQHAA